MIHELKIYPQYYRAVECGDKTFEVRLNDRGYQKGDTVILREFDPDYLLSGDYTESKPLGFLIGYVLPIDDKRVVFSLLTPPNADEKEN